MSDAAVVKAEPATIEMAEATPPRSGRTVLRHGMIILGMIASAMAGCARPAESKPETMTNVSARNRRLQLWKITEPVTAGTTSTQPADAQAPLAQPYRINVRTIVNLTYQKSPLVTASREEMIAAQHGLAEFKANLNRLEPFVEATGNTTKYPKRRDSEGASGEVVGGIQKETFDGATIRLEGGLSGSRVEFGEVKKGQEQVEEGSGGLVRARIEVPFAGSRKRQSRVISAAFQESTARKAVLDYLSDYRQQVQSALTYYNYALYYQSYVRAYQRMVQKQEELLEDPRLEEGDRPRVQSAIGDAEVLVDSYQDNYRTYVLSLMRYLGISPDEEYVLENRNGEPSPYLEPARTRQGKEAMLADAYENNPKFRVLENGITDEELKRDQAIKGDFDVTAFMEGTQFAFGPETYDDRVGGWEVTAGLTVRLNDQRVLTATRMKAEAQIRKYRARIEAEQLLVQRSIATYSDRLCSYYDSRSQILQNIEDTEAEFEERRKAFFGDNPQDLTIDDVLTALNSHISAHIRLGSNRYYTWLAEARLMLATGEVYQLAGLRLDENGNGAELRENQ